MRLYFMRHGIAAPSTGVGAGEDDRERKLTPKGSKRVHKAARGMMALALSFDRILTSPVERARQTAKIVAQVLHMEERVVEIAQLGPGQSVQDLLGALRAHAEDKNILLVGHEPLLSRTVAFLLSGSAGLEIRLKKGGVCCLEVARLGAKERAVLHWSLAPKQLRAMA